MSKTLATQKTRDNGLDSLVKPPIVEKDMVVLMIVLQDLNQGFFSLRAGPRKYTGTQSRGGKPRRGREKSLCDV